jgi:DNA repair protein RecN (Recombination protein N)
VLRDLHIRNLAVLEEASIELGSGFNVLSGETGAGKSIVVDSLALLAGLRASNDQIRTGAETLTVTGFFVPEGESWRELLREAGIEPEGEELVVRREVSRSGRNRVFVDDQPVTLKLLGELAPSLLRIHGQRDELGLVDPELQRFWLDRCGGAEAAGLLEATRLAYTESRRLDERLERLQGDQRARQERIELLRYQLAEIGGLGLAAGEEEGLRQERDLLRHSEAFERALGGAIEGLYDFEPSAQGALVKAAHALEGIRAWEARAPGWLDELEELRIRLAELEPALRRRLSEVEANPGRLAAVEDRLASLEWLFHKYGTDSAGLLALAERHRAELDDLDEGAGKGEELAAKAAAALAAYKEAALALSAARRRWAGVLAERVTGHLRELALDKAIFEVRLERRRAKESLLQDGGVPVEYGPHGIDQVVFHFSPNPGEELRPLAKVASGGELSRLYLAVQLAARTEGQSSAITLVFDEVDTGISGAEAAVLGAKIRRLASGGQILAVTHLPQVAAHADRHFKVSKQVKGGRTFTAVEPLGDGGRVEEVARMLAGSAITELSLSHARDLIDRSAAS